MLPNFPRRVTGPFLAGLFGILLLPGFVSAQTAAPARNGNVYNGTAHEPSPGGVHASERAAGVAASPGQVQQENRDLETMDRQLTDKAKQGGNAAAVSPSPPNATGR